MKILLKFDEIWTKFSQNFDKNFCEDSAKIHWTSSQVRSLLRRLRGSLPGGKPGRERRSPRASWGGALAWRSSEGLATRFPSTLSVARSRLDQRQFSRPNTHFSAFFETSKKIIFSRANFVNFCRNFAKFCKILQIFKKFQNFSKFWRFCQNFAKILEKFAKILQNLLARR